MLIFVTRLSCNVFNEVILKFIRPEPNQVFRVDKSKELTFLKRIKPGLSHLAHHKFRKFPRLRKILFVASRGQEIEILTHFFFHCSNYHCARKTNFEKVNKIDSIALKQNDQVIAKLFVFGNEKLNPVQNKFILTSTI